MTFRNHEYFSNITKDKSCAFVSVGQNVGAYMEALHEALREGCVFASDVLRHQGIVELVGG